MRAVVPLNERVNPTFVEPEQYQINSLAFGNTMFNAHYDHGRVSTSGKYQMEPVNCRAGSFQGASSYVSDCRQATVPERTGSVQAFRR